MSGPAAEVAFEAFLTGTRLAGDGAKWASRYRPTRGLKDPFEMITHFRQAGSVRPMQFVLYSFFVCTGRSMSDPAPLLHDQLLLLAFGYEVDDRNNFVIDFVADEEIARKARIVLDLPAVRHGQPVISRQVHCNECRLCENNKKFGDAGIDRIVQHAFFSLGGIVSAGPLRLDQKGTGSTRTI